MFKPKDKQQGHSETPSNLAFEGASYYSSILFPYFRRQFFIFENVLRLVNKMQATENKDLCGGEPGYLTPKRDDLYVRYLG